jgi:membrane protease YdiL (CAAX protease family)
MSRKKIGLQILFSFLFSWLVALIMFLAHIKLTSITGILFLALLYMPGPAIATFVIQKFILKGGFKSYGWTLEKKAIRWILLTPLLFLILTLFTFGIIGLLGNTGVMPIFGKIDFTQQNLNQQIAEMAKNWIDISKVKMPSIDPRLLFSLMVGQAIVTGSTISLPFMFGEEFGWRGLLLFETRSLGFLKANIFIGLVWGIWHLPIILMGHNYPNHPYVGIIMMCLFTLSIAPLFAYVRLKTKSILGSCMLHGMINATGGMYILFIAGRNELYSSIAGWAGIIAGTILSIGIFVLDKKLVREYRTITPPRSARSIGMSPTQ